MIKEIPRDYAGPGVRAGARAHGRLPLASGRDGRGGLHKRSAVPYNRGTTLRFGPWCRTHGTGRSVRSACRTAGYTYQTWMEVEVNALNKAVTDKISTEHLGPAAAARSFTRTTARRRGSAPRRAPALSAVL